MDQQKNCPFRLMVLDLDGTLLNSRKEVSRENLEALTRAAEMGIHIVPCTGRFFDGMPRVIRELPYLRYAITMNGAQILDVREKKVLHRAELSPEEADRVFGYLDHMPVIYDCYQDDWGWMDCRFREEVTKIIPDPHIQRIVLELRTPLANLRETIRGRNRGIQKIQLFFRDPRQRQQGMAQLKEAFPHLSITSSLPGNVEINSASAHKGQALLELCRILEIAPGAVIAFGDGLNDATMLKAAGIGVAMANADPAVKAICDCVTGTNDQNGVAEAIARFCFGQRE